MNEMTSALTSSEIAQAESILNEAPFAYLGMVEPGGPYVVPLNFAYVPAGAFGTQRGPAGPRSRPNTAPFEGRIYFHTSEGRKTQALAADPRVSLAITVGVSFEQGDTPCADGFSYRSLLVWGRARRLERQDQRELILREIVAKYDPGAVERPFDEADLARTLVYEVVIEAATYKQQLR